MNTFWSPVGSQGAPVYWRRRFVALIMLLGLIALITYAVTNFSRSMGPTGPLSNSSDAQLSERPDAGSAQPEQATAAAPDQGQAGGGNVDSNGGRVSDVPAMQDQETAAGQNQPNHDDMCQRGVVTVTATTAQDVFVAGEPAEIGLLITNVGRQGCRIDAGTQALELLVMDGDVTVWSSDHCQKNASSSIVTLGPEQSTSSKVQWSMNTSAEGCGQQPVRVAPGSYSLMARVGELYSSPKPFTIEAGK